jgi:6-phosphogluconolactonase
VSDVEIVVADDPIEETAQRLAEAVRAGGHIGLSGGGTPGPAYTRAAELAPDWSRVELWWIDDRAVPPDHDDSNYKLVHETLLSHVAVPPRAVHRIHGELSPEEAAKRYDADLQGVVLDLAIMGIGPDGHTASLFPGGPELDERTRLAIATDAGMEPRVPRVTMTIPLLAETRLMVYLVCGADKAAPAARAFRQGPSARTPASLVRGRRTVAILDDAAAGA